MEKLFLYKFNLTFSIKHFNFYSLLSLILFFSFSNQKTFAQDPQYTQFYAAYAALGPSFAGTGEGTRAFLLYRNQWAMIPKQFVTTVFSADHYFNNVNSGVGLYYYRDVAGVGALTSNNASVQYNYSVSITRRLTFIPGIQMSYVHRSLDFDKLTFGDQLTFSGARATTVEVPTDPAINYLDFASSVLFTHPKYWAGITLDHLNMPDQTFYSETNSRVPITYRLYGGYRFFKKTGGRKYRLENIVIAALYKAQKKYDQLDLGCYYTKKPFIVGVWYRGIPLLKSYEHVLNNDAVSLLAGYVNDKIKIGYSYDIAISRLGIKSGGSHEITLTYYFNLDNRSKKKRKPPAREVSCPKFIDDLL